MRLACATITYQLAGVSIVKSLDHLKELGFKYVDLPAYGQFQPQYYPLSAQEGLARRFKELEMEPVSIIYLPTANPGSFNRAERMAAVEELKPAARLMKRLGGKFVMFCEAGGRPAYKEDLDKDQAFDNSIETVKAFCEWCESLSMSVLLELCPYGGNLCSIEAMKEMLDRVGAPNLYANVDLGHCNLQKINPARFKKLGDKLVGVHISDNISAGNEGCIKEQDLIIGEGDTDFAPYFAELARLDVDANARKAGFGECHCTIETVESAQGRIVNADLAIMQSRDYVLSRLPVFRDQALEG